MTGSIIGEASNTKESIKLKFLYIRTTLFASDSIHLIWKKWGATASRRSDVIAVTPCKARKNKKYNVTFIRKAL